MNSLIRTVSKSLNANRPVDVTHAAIALAIEGRGIEKAFSAGNYRLSINGLRAASLLALKESIGLKLKRPADYQAFKKALKAIMADRFCPRLVINLAKDSDPLIFYSLAKMLVIEGVNMKKYGNHLPQKLVKIIDGSLLRLVFISNSLIWRSNKGAA